MSQLCGVAAVGLFRVVVEDVACAKVHPYGVEISRLTVLNESENGERPRYDGLGLERCSRPELWKFLYSAQVVLNAHLVRKVKAPRGR